MMGFISLESQRDQRGRGKSLTSMRERTGMFVPAAGGSTVYGSRKCERGTETTLVEPQCFQLLQL